MVEQALIPAQYSIYEEGAHPRVVGLCFCITLHGMPVRAVAPDGLRQPMMIGGLTISISRVLLTLRLTTIGQL